MSTRPAYYEEIKDHFRGVDSSIVSSIYMADICYVSDTGAFIIDDIARMFAFILRRTHPALED